MLFVSMVCLTVGLAGSMRKAIVSLTMTGFLVALLTTLAMACGLVVTSNFAGCDPCLQVNSIIRGTMFKNIITN
jgi:hypothetical protein